MRRVAADAKLQLESLDLASLKSIEEFAARLAQAHPGYAATNLQGVGAQMTGSKFGSWIMNTGNSLLAQSAAQGALPTLYAATVSEVQGEEFFGPDGFLEMKGFPRRSDSNAKSKDLAAAQRLWEVSEQLPGVKLPG